MRSRWIRITGTALGAIILGAIRDSSVKITVLQYKDSEGLRRLLLAYETNWGKAQIGLAVINAIVKETPTMQ